MCVYTSSFKSVSIADGGRNVSFQNIVVEDGMVVLKLQHAQRQTDRQRKTNKYQLQDTEKQDVNVLQGFNQCTVGIAQH